MTPRAPPAGIAGLLRDCKAKARINMLFLSQTPVPVFARQTPAMETRIGFVFKFGREDLR